MPKHENPTGEAMNTPVAKFVKSDGELALELRQIVDACIGKMAELHSRGLVCTVSLDNGEGSFGKPTLVAFNIIKKVVNYINEDAQRMQGQQGR